jgi:gamma-glutamyltranspeptidase/glutathione hydrolase
VAYGNELLLNGKAPLPGQLMKNPTLASVLQEIQKTGKQQFHEGWIAQNIVQTIAELGGELSLQDLKHHKTEFTNPIKTTYKDFTLYEVGPNSQGIIALMALNILEKMNVRDMKHNTSQYLHVLIEALRIAFHDARMYVADAFNDTSVNYQQMIDVLLSKEYSIERSKLIHQDKHNKDITHG